EHVGLGFGKWHLEIDCDSDAFAGPYQHRVLPPQVGGEPPLGIELERSELLWAGFALDHLELKAMEVHGVRHAVEVVPDQPRFDAVAPHLDGSLPHHEHPVIDAPATLRETEPQWPLSGVGDRDGIDIRQPYWDPRGIADTPANPQLEQRTRFTFLK